MEIGNMRRRTREIKDINEIDKIIEEGKICHLAMCCDDQPYVIPMLYGFDGESIYFHCADVGTKLDILRQNNKVCIEIQSSNVNDIIHNSGKPCDWGIAFESVVIFGNAKFVEDRAEKVKAFDLLVNKMRPEKYTEKNHDYVEKKIVGSVLIKVDIEKKTGKKWNGIK